MRMAFSSSNRRTYIVIAIGAEDNGPTLKRTVRMADLPLSRAANPARQHRQQHPVLEDEMVIERRERMESRHPENRVAEPRMDRCDRCARIMREAGQRGDRHPGEERQGMAFEPCAGNRR